MQLFARFAGVFEAWVATWRTCEHGLDSFATMLLATIRPDGDWRSKDYDGRIVSATALIRDNSEAKQFIASFHHVIVDEVQDLVGVRAALVAIVLENAKGGFTLFGDPAQGIYNFQVEGEERRLGSAVLYGWLRKRFATVLEEETLGQNSSRSLNGLTSGSLGG